MMDCVCSENLHFVIVVVWFVTDLKEKLYASFSFSTIFTLLIIKKFM